MRRTLTLSFGMLGAAAFAASCGGEVAPHDTGAKLAVCWYAHGLDPHEWDPFEPKVLWDRYRRRQHDAWAGAH